MKDKLKEIFKNHKIQQDDLFMVDFDKVTEPEHLIPIIKMLFNEFPVKFTKGIMDHYGINDLSKKITKEDLDESHN